MEKCNLCGRKCFIDRTTQIGYCSSSNDIKIAKIMIHNWEEPVISGTNGSGAIFFSNCNLKCVFCQNYQISHEGKGKYFTIQKLAKEFELLEKQGVHNINLVTPTHYTDQIIAALDIYKPNIPIIWNTNGYETVETINKLKNYVDIFLFDLKYVSPEISQKYSAAYNYFEVASQAILEARKNLPNDIFDNNIMQKGIIIRHLVLPNNTNDSINVLKWIKQNLPTTLVSIMSQYIPQYKALDMPEINRKITKLEYKRIIYMCNELKLNGFMQDLSSADCIYIPDFDSQIKD